MRRITLIALVLLTIGAYGQSISIRQDYAFHDASWGAEYGDLEDVANEDIGGVLYLFVDNLAASDSVDNVVVKDSAGNIGDIYGWYPWPGRMDAANGNFTGITIKGDTIPLSENSFVRVIVSTVNGAVDSIDIASLKTPNLRLANCVPSQDYSSIYLFFRNDGSNDVTVDSLYFNTTGYADSDAELSFSGTSTIGSGEVGILQFTSGWDFSEPELAAIRVKFQDDVTMTSHFSSAAIRTVIPRYTLGSWHSSGFDPDKEYGRKRLRRLGIQVLQGPGNPSLMHDGYNRYHMQTIREASFGEPFDISEGEAYVDALKDSAMMEVWSVDDEPDLNGKDIDQQLDKALTYMRWDTSTAVHITLASQKKYQKYGFYSDVVAMDHYSAPSAPNIIPLTWIPAIGRTGEAKEALEYSDYLKWNTEPRRNWSWVQLSAGVWDVQPEPVAVNYQFWAHVMGGAKGLKYFVAQSDSKDDHPEQWDEVMRTFKEFKQLRGLALYGEPSQTTSSSNANILSRSLIGTDHMAVICINNSLTFTGDVLSGFETTYNEELYNVEAWVPDWISPDDVYMITEIGKSYDITVEVLGPNLIRITPDSALKDRSHAFVIGTVDNVDPQKLEGLKVAQYIDSANYTLSWKEPHDNIGVQGYNIYYNNVLIEKVHHPIYEVINKSNTCSAWWKVEPFDSNGNTGEADSLFFFLSGPAIAVADHPNDTTVTIGSTTYSTAHSNIVSTYQWQYFDGSSWVDFTESLLAIGTNSSTLQLNNLASDVEIRCVMESSCGGTVTTDEATITVIDDTGVPHEFLEWTFFPNPATDEVWVNVGSDQTLRYDIISIDGKSRLSGTLNGAIDVSSLKAGLYLLRLTKDGESSVKKLMIN